MRPPVDVSEAYGRLHDLPPLASLSSTRLVDSLFEASFVEISRKALGDIIHAQNHHHDHILHQVTQQQCQTWDQRCDLVW
jgi:hypothetical protein